MNTFTQFIAFAASIWLPALAATGDVPWQLPALLAIAAVIILAGCYGLWRNGWIRTNDPGQRINLGERRDQRGGGQR